MLKCAGEPVPILKPFKAIFSYDISTPNQPLDKVMKLRMVDKDTIIESTGNEIFINGVDFLEWIEQESEKFTPEKIQRVLKTMVISAVYGEDRYLKQQKEGKLCNNYGT